MRSAIEVRAYLLQDKRDQRKAVVAALARFDERVDGADLARRGSVPDESSRGLKDTCATQDLDLGQDLRMTAAESRSEGLDIEHIIRMPVEKDNDVPGEERGDVLLDELHYPWPENTLKISHTLPSP